MSRKTRYIMIALAILLILCSTTSCAPITYTYDELRTDLIKAEIINYSVAYEPEFQANIEVLKTLTVEECDYAITEIANIEFERTIGTEPNWPRGKILVLYYPSYKLWFSCSGYITKPDEKSETGERGYNVTTPGLEELIDYLLNNEATSN